jgi:hypothetical protein
MDRAIVRGFVGENVCGVVRLNARLNVPVIMSFSVSRTASATATQGAAWGPRRGRQNCGPACFNHYIWGSVDRCRCRSCWWKWPALGRDCINCRAYCRNLRHSNATPDCCTLLAAVVTCKSFCCKMIRQGRRSLPWNGRCNIRIFMAIRTAFTFQSVERSLRSGLGHLPADAGGTRRRATGTLGLGIGMAGIR